MIFLATSITCAMERIMIITSLTPECIAFTIKATLIWMNHILISTIPQITWFTITDYFNKVVAEFEGANLMTKVTEIQIRRIVPS